MLLQDVKTCSEAVTFKIVSSLDYIKNIAAWLIFHIEVKELRQVFMVGYLGLGIFDESEVSHLLFLGIWNADGCYHTRQKFRMKSLLFLPLSLFQELEQNLYKSQLGW